MTCKNWKRAGVWLDGVWRAGDRLDKYLKVLDSLEDLREIENGQVPTDLEEAYYNRLDELWYSMSEQEQEDYEKFFSKEKAEHTECV